MSDREDQRKDKNFIGIVMGGYLDENSRLMDRTELNRRISAIKEENKNLRNELKNLKRNMKHEPFIAYDGIREDSKIPLGTGVLKVNGEVVGIVTNVSVGDTHIKECPVIGKVK